jgi:hypothetical protein
MAGYQLAPRSAGRRVDPTAHARILSAQRHHPKPYVGDLFSVRSDVRIHPNGSTSPSASRRHPTAVSVDVGGGFQPRRNP